MEERQVEIERFRIGDAMRVEDDAVSDELAAREPDQLIQPLYEDARVHGGARDTGSARIRIDGSIRDDRLPVTVSDPAGSGANGNAMEPDGERFGLRYVQGRMQQFYGGDARFDLSTNDGRTVATLDLPK